MNLILDLDGTLVADTDKEDIMPSHRPYLEEFLDYVFSVCENVSVWSAASEEWVLPILETIKTPRPFHFVWCGKTTPKVRWGYMPYKIKKLKKVWKAFPSYTKHNTLILDNTPATYVENYGNAIGIYTYISGEDNELKKLQEFFPKIIENFEVTGTVRHIHKYALP